MKKMIIDFETYSEVDIGKAGMYNYVADPSTRALCLAYRIAGQKTKLWVEGDPIPESWKDITPKTKIYGINVAFDFYIWNGCFRKAYPEVPEISLSQCIDISAIALRCKMPASLDKLARTLGCDNQKLAIGKQLIRLCCTPGHNPKIEHFQDLHKYCIADVDATSEILSKLPVDELTDTEQKLWELTARMNRTGVPIDIEAVQGIIKYLARYTAELKKELPVLTNGAVMTPGQTARMKKYCLDHGVNIPNMQADTVTKYLEKDIPENVKRLLEIRQMAGRTSVTKFLKLDELKHKSEKYGWVVQGNLLYYGAGTGRWAGRGFQYHNLPRAKVDNPQEYIDRFLANDPTIEQPIKTASALIRPMIKAPEGFKLLVSDYSSIENRVLAWMCDDQKTLDLFREGKCQYIDMASFMYNIPYEQVDKKSEQRQMGKAVVLGCGYMMGAARFMDVAADWGFSITLAESQGIIDKYRKRYILVKNMWFAYANAVMSAMRNPGKVIKTHRCSISYASDRNGLKWLRIVLPSGRPLLYFDPRIEKGKYGMGVTYSGYSSTIHSMQRTTLTPGLITENIVQATARDILAAAKLRLVDAMPEAEIILSVHDEIGCVIAEKYVDEGLMERYSEILCKKMTWCEDLPLEAVGYISERYRKD